MTSSDNSRIPYGKSVRAAFGVSPEYSLNGVWTGTPTNVTQVIHQVATNQPDLHGDNNTPVIGRIGASTNDVCGSQLRCGPPNVRNGLNLLLGFDAYSVGVFTREEHHTI